MGQRFCNNKETRPGDLVLSDLIGNSKIPQSVNNPIPQSTLVEISQNLSRLVQLEKISLETSKIKSQHKSVAVKTIQSKSKPIKIGLNK